MHNTASLNIDAVTLTSNDILQELVYQSLDRITGGLHHVISRDLPVNGHHVLAMDKHRRPILITFDPADGGRAFLSAMSALEHLQENRGWLFRLYPALFEQNNSMPQAIRIEDMRLILVSPEPPPGSKLLRNMIPQLAIMTFQAISINGEIGLLLSDETHSHSNDAVHDDEQNEDLPPFRQGHYMLNNKEEEYFDALNL